MFLSFRYEKNVIYSKLVNNPLNVWFTITNSWESHYIIINCQGKHCLQSRVSNNDETGKMLHNLCLAKQLRLAKSRGTTNQMTCVLHIIILHYAQKSAIFGSESSTFVWNFVKQIKKYRFDVENLFYTQIKQIQIEIIEAQLFSTNALSANTFSLNVSPSFIAIYSQSIVNTKNFFIHFY